jgi:hypothetical protein
VESPVQLTFEELGLFDNDALRYWSHRFNDGYGTDATAVFETLLPKGYSLAFIKKLLSNDYTCVCETDAQFDQTFEKYRNSSIQEWERIPCKCCGNTEKTVVTDYTRVGKYFNEKGEVLSRREW